MADHNELGSIGESLALEYLQNKGYQILETNWRYKNAEIDIIAKDDDALIIIEVKTRSSAAHGTPDSFISSKKMKLLFQACNAYMNKINHQWQIRFDIIGIIIEINSPPKISHFEDAFFI